MSKVLQAGLAARNKARAAARGRQAARVAAQGKADLAKYGPPFTQELTPKLAYGEINAAANQKFQPQYQTIADQQRQSTQQDANLSAWYNQYRQGVNDAYAHTQGLYNQAQAQVGQFAAGSSALDATQRAQIAQQQQADAANRGAQVDPGGDLRAQQASMARRDLSGSFGALLAGQGANAGAYLQNKLPISQGSEMQQHLNESNRRQNLDTTKRALQSQEGDYRTTLRGQLRTSERQYGLQRSAFGLKTASAEAAAQAAAAKTAADAAKATETGRHNRATEATGQQNANANTQRANNPRAPGRTPADPGAKAAQGVQRQISDAWNVVRTLARGNPNANGAQLAQYFNSGGWKYSPTIKRAALNLWIYGKLDQSTYNALNAGGGRIPKQWLSKSPY